MEQGATHKARQSTLRISPLRDVKSQVRCPITHSLGNGRLVVFHGLASEEDMVSTHTQSLSLFSAQSQRSRSDVMQHHHRLAQRADRDGPLSYESNGHRTRFSVTSFISHLFHPVRRTIRMPRKTAHGTRDTRSKLQMILGDHEPYARRCS